MDRLPPRCNDTRSALARAAAARPVAAPRLVITLGYEETPRVQLLASGADDRARMALWLERSDLVEQIPLAVAAFLDENAA